MPGSVELASRETHTATPPHKSLKREMVDSETLDEKFSYQDERFEEVRHHDNKRADSMSPDDQVPVKVERPEENEMKSFAHTTMNELLGLYGYDRLADSDIGRYRMHCVTSQKHRYSADSSSDASPQPNDDQGRTSAMNLKTSGLSPVLSSAEIQSSSKRAKLFETGISLTPLNLGDRPSSARNNITTPPHPNLTLASPIRGYDEEITCSWCRKQGICSFTLPDNEGTKSFCSEKCFAACRRAAFKRTRVCDWCKQIRHPRKFLENPSSDGRLQFCSNQCLESYKMAIFCKEIHNGKNEDEKEDTACASDYTSSATNDEPGLVDLRMRSPTIKINGNSSKTGEQDTSSIRIKSVSPNGVFTLKPNLDRPKRISRDDASSNMTSISRHRNVDNRKYSTPETTTRQKESPTRFRHNELSLRKAQKLRSSNDQRPSGHKLVAGGQKPCSSISPSLKKTVRTAWPPIGGTEMHLAPQPPLEALPSMAKQMNPMNFPFAGCNPHINLSAIQSMMASNFLQGQIPTNANMYPAGLFPGFPYSAPVPPLQKESMDKLDPSSFFLGLMAAGNAKPAVSPQTREPPKPKTTAMDTTESKFTDTSSLEAAKPKPLNGETSHPPATNASTKEHPVVQSNFPFPMLLLPFPVPLPIPIPIPIPVFKDLQKTPTTDQSQPDIISSETASTETVSDGSAQLEAAEHDSKSPEIEPERSPTKEDSTFDAMDLTTRKRGSSSEETSRKRPNDDVNCTSADRPIVVANKKPKILA